MFWKLKETKDGPFRPPAVPRVPGRPKPPAAARRSDVLGPPRPPAPGGYEWELRRGSKKKRKR